MYPIYPLLVLIAALATKQIEDTVVNVVLLFFPETFHPMKDAEVKTDGKSKVKHSREKGSVNFVRRFRNSFLQLYDW
jgi:hypothetical protein